LEASDGIGGQAEDNVNIIHILLGKLYLSIYFVSIKKMSSFSAWFGYRMGRGIVLLRWLEIKGFYVSWYHKLTPALRG
jgi:hypothetical protein